METDGTFITDLTGVAVLLLLVGTPALAQYGGTGYTGGGSSCSSGCSGGGGEDALNAIMKPGTKVIYGYEGKNGPAGGNTGGYTVPGTAPGPATHAGL